MGLRIRLLGLITAAAACCLSLPATAAPASAAPLRRFSLSLSPVAGDLSIAVIRFPRAGRHALSARSLRITSPAPIGGHLAAAAALTRPGGHGRVALAVVLNPASAPPGPSVVRLLARAAGSLGAPQLLRFADPVTRTPAHPPAWLCALASHRHAPATSALFSRGRPLSGLSARATIAAAFELACGLPHPAELETALAASPPPGGCSAPAPGGCEGPPPPLPPGPPRCAPCRPSPGTACPLSAFAAVCVAAQDERAPSAVGGAH